MEGFSSVQPDLESILLLLLVIAFKNINTLTPFSDRIISFLSHNNLTTGQHNDSRTLTLGPQAAEAEEVDAAVKATEISRANVLQTWPHSFSLLSLNRSELFPHHNTAAVQSYISRFSSEKAKLLKIHVRSETYHQSIPFPGNAVSDHTSTATTSNGGQFYNSFRSTDWYPDSGARHHVAPKNNIHNIQQSEPPLNLKALIKSLSVTDYSQGLSISFTWFTHLLILLFS